MTLLTRDEPYTGWTSFFPLLPRRTISGKWVWLRPIYRRYRWNGIVGSQNGEFHVEYSE